MLELFDKVGPLGYPLALCSILAVTIIVERALVLSRRQLWDGGIVDETVELIAKGDREGARRRLFSVPGPFGFGGRLLLDTMGGKTLREEAVSIWLESIRARLVRRIGLLQLIATIAPMLGLLGTVVGMVIAFREISAHQGPVGPALLAEGLWQAMLTTVVGLSIALPATVAASLFKALAESRISRLAGALSRLSLALETTAETSMRNGRAA